MVTYSPTFFESISSISTATAAVVAEYLNARLQPSSVLDVGCGRGQYLKRFGELNVGKCAGIEGPWIRDGEPVVPMEQIHVIDLAASPLEGIDIGRFDLTICIEVAEHLPPERALEFVAFLCRTAPVIYFSAAIPLQGGVNHVNERRLSYWIDLFNGQGMTLLDVIRPKLWEDSRVDPCVRQNGVLFAAEGVAPSLGLDHEPTFLGRDLVHPELFEQTLTRWNDNNYLEGMLAGRNLRRLVFGALGHRLRGRLAGKRA